MCKWEKIGESNIETEEIIKNIRKMDRFPIDYNVGFYPKTSISLTRFTT